MPYLPVRHRVTDFGAWKRVFDSISEAQRQPGLHVQRVLRNLDDSGEVVLLFEVSDLDRAWGFVASPRVPDAQEESGVVDEPDILFLEDWP